MIDISNVWRPIKTHTLSATTSSGSTLTSAFTTQVNVVMVTATAACFVQFDSTPTAITGTGTASVYITELSR